MDMDWVLQVVRGGGAERKCEADILSWTRVLQVFRSSLQCLSDGDKCLFVSAKLWIFWILSWSLNVLVIVIAVSGEILAAQWSYS